MTRELGQEGGNKDRPRPFKDLKTNTKTWALECIGNQNSCNVPTAQHSSILHQYRVDREEWVTLTLRALQ